VQHDVKIDHDLETTPLEIKTDSSVNDDVRVELRFFDVGGVSAGGLLIGFYKKMEYQLENCRPYVGFPSTLPSAIDKVWTIILTKSSGVRLRILCNGVEVANVLMSDTTCSKSEWSQYWNRPVKKIEFHSYDTASDNYRPYTGE
jgi:hypothetical protein